ncbi:ribosomal protein S18 [Diplogelasinospora grovesii]|uniref:Small ribosomal subunit protein bS18m n=1 Tax=Diplogelasinospora grovesii TaxID=303347 RepID=A0AAN6NL03_9PEZI|nr:ribosomal protein S18 [Diplogelasinospora grovesii]
MASRLGSSLLRQTCQAPQHQQRVQQLSTTAATAAFRNLKPTNSSPNRSLTDLDDSSPRSTPNDLLRNIFKSGRSQNRENHPREAVKDLRAAHTTDSYLRHMPRRWRAGDLYAPKDLSPVEMKKWRTPHTPKKDVLDMLGLNPLDNYRNFSLISDYMTPFGRIKHSSETGLRPVNQRKMAKTIRRAIGLGIHPSVHRHPEILRLNSRNLPQATSGRL